jgi:RNA polymerase sigma factor (TIGR02999 family)
MASSLASLEGWPGEGAMTSGVPKKSRTCGQAAGRLIDGLLAWEWTRGVNELDASGGAHPGTRKELAESIPLGCGSFSVPPMSEVTHILSAIEQGDPHAAAQLLPLVYDELRKLAAQRLAQEKPGQTLQATALVHEAYLQLVGTPAEGAVPEWAGRAHFFATAAEAMRRILVEKARRKRRQKHGGGLPRVDIQLADLVSPVPDEYLLALDEAMTQLGAEDPVRARLVQLRFYAGLSNEDAARVLGISGVTAKRYWRYARAWLHREVCKGDDSGA